MSGISVGFVDEGDGAMVTVHLDGVTITLSTDTARWLADDLRTWADRVDLTNRNDKESS